MLFRQLFEAETSTYKKIHVAVPANLRCGLDEGAAAPLPPPSLWAPVERTATGIPEVTPRWVSENIGAFRLVDVRELAELVSEPKKIPASPHGSGLARSASRSVRGNGEGADAGGNDADAGAADPDAGAPEVERFIAGSAAWSGCAQAAPERWAESPRPGGIAAAHRPGCAPVWRVLRTSS